MVKRTVRMASFMMMTFDVFPKQRFWDCGRTDAKIKSSTASRSNRKEAKKVRDTSTHFLIGPSVCLKNLCEPSQIVPKRTAFFHPTWWKDYFSPMTTLDSSLDDNDWPSERMNLPTWRVVSTALDNDPSFYGQFKILKLWEEFWESTRDDYVFLKKIRISTKRRKRI